jgi:formiminotetrahydrofolate cyclodeaminase
MVQVSTNLTDFEVTPPHIVLRAVEREAEAAGVRVASCELIGLIPRKALEMAVRDQFRFEHFDTSRVLEDQLEAALPARELSSLLARLAAPGTPEGGGSAAAASAAIAAALAMKIARLARVEGRFDEDVEFFRAAVQRDADAFEKLRHAGSSDAAIELAALVPIEIAERAGAMATALEAMSKDVPARLQSDVETAIGIARAAAAGAVATARANLSARPHGPLHERIAQLEVRFRSGS